MRIRLGCAWSPPENLRGMRSCGANERPAAARSGAACGFCYDPRMGVSSSKRQREPRTSPAPAPDDERPDIETALRLDRAPRRRRFAMIVAALTIVAAMVGALLFWWSAGQKRDVRYRTEPVRAGDLVVTVTATGAVQPTNQVDVSSELSGIVREVLVDFNSRVEVGQVLATLDTDKLAASAASAKARLAAAEADVQEAEATVVETKLDYERKRTLVAKEMISVQELDVAKAAYTRALARVESARADVAAAEAAYKVIETDLSKSRIRSPITGIVLHRNVEPGQTVASTLQAPVLFTIAEDLTKMEVQVDVDEADVGKVHEGQKAVFVVDAYPDRIFTAEIRELRFGSEIVQGVVTYKAVLTTDNSGLLLRPGMTATAEITVEKITDALSVPNSALRFTPPAARAPRDERSFLERLIPGRPRLRAPSENAAAGRDRRIWILVDGEPRERPVKTGPTDGVRTQILDGDLKAGQEVIVDVMSAGR